ncbi:hypothetical protein NST84_03960 [Paenibacillus sp. FSL R7-0345]|uniref:hypothetical protein n=1 Tax=Paenibacillus sp. FSL R7-0345 TaxID=2954535 RepID=UPI00315A607B
MTEVHFALDLPILPTFGGIRGTFALNLPILPTFGGIRGTFALDLPILPTFGGIRGTFALDSPIPPAIGGIGGTLLYSFHSFTLLPRALSSSCTFTHAETRKMTPGHPGVIPNPIF